MTQNLELVRVNEKEFKIADHRFVILDDSILYIEAHGEQTDEFAEAIRRNYASMYSFFPGKINHLINLNNSGKSSPESRKFYKEMNEHERTEKVAVFGIHPVAKVLASFVIGITTKKNIQFFSSEASAIAWLRK